MKTRQLLTALLLMFAMTASAQIQLLYTSFGRNVIDRNKKMFWMDGDSDPCFTIQNYKKAGNTETFTLEEKEDKTNHYNVTMKLDDKGLPVQITLKHKMYGTQTSSVKTTSGSADEDRRLVKYFNGLAGNPDTPDTPSAAELKDDPASAVSGGKESVGNKVSNATKGAVNKVKGLFKKKK